MNDELKYQIAPKGLTVWRIHAVISSVIKLIIPAIIFICTSLFDWYSWIQYAVLALWAIDAVLKIVFLPKLEWKHWRYEVREQEIEIQSGIFIVQRTLIPMIRVQHVDTTQGPILKRYNLSEIAISTAATIHEIPALKAEEANELRKQISKLARVAEDDV